MKNVNVYDFDHTIYDGDASLDFIRYCLTRDVRLWAYLPAMSWDLVLYVLGFRTRKQVKQTAFKFLKDLKDADAVVEEFWRLHSKKIKAIYADSKSDNNIIISASPEFLLGPIATTLSADLIATNMDKNTGSIIGENCRGREKVLRLREEYSNLVVDDMYSDSLSDMPLLKLAQNGYIVSGRKIIPLGRYKQPSVDRLKDPKFIRFILVGCINATIGILLAYLFSFYIASPQLAFAIGFMLGLVPSYFLNSVITFKDRLFSWKKYGSFIVSYIPNFLTMLLLVHVFTDYFGIYPLLTYTLAVMIAVPVTYILLSIYTFNDGRGDVKK